MIKKYCPLAHTINQSPKKKPRALQGLWQRPRWTGRTPYPCRHHWRKLQWSSFSSWLAYLCVWLSLLLSSTQGEEEPRRWQRHCQSCWTSNGQDFGCWQPPCNQTPLHCSCRHWGSDSCSWCGVRPPRFVRLASSDWPGSQSNWPTCALPVYPGRSGWGTVPCHCF